MFQEHFRSNDCAHCFVFFHTDVIQEVSLDGPSVVAIGTQVGFCVSVKTMLRTKVYMQLSFSSPPPFTSCICLLFF